MVSFHSQWEGVVAEIAVSGMKKRSVNNADIPDKIVP